MNSFPSEAFDAGMIFGAIDVDTAATVFRIPKTSFSSYEFSS